MLYQSTETYVAWAAGLLLLGGGLAAAGGAFAIARARRLPYFQLRRQNLLRGWQLVLIGGVLLIAAGMVFGLGQRAVQVVIPPTLTPTASLTPTLTPIPPTAAATSTITLTPLDTLSPAPTSSPTLTLTPADTSTPTASASPALPLALITPPGTLTVTPPAEAVAANIRFSLRDNCEVQGSRAYFDQVPKTIYAHFYYDNWLPGVEWSGVWYRDGAPIYAETRIWDGSTGGCGFTDYDNTKLWWPQGTYEVRIFVGERWLTSNQFIVVLTTPSPTFTPSPPTATPTSTRTPRPTATSTPTRTPRPPTLTPTITPTRTPRPPTSTASATRTPRPTITLTSTPTP